jgi:hypothetical protein
MKRQDDSAVAQKEAIAGVKACLAHLALHGLLMKADTRLPSVTTVVAGAPVRGSWWSHPLAHTIFFALRDLADHRDVLLVKLVDGKDTFIHRRLWAEVAAIALAEEPWQTRRLSAEAGKLLWRVHAEGSLECEGPAARLIETRLLVHGMQMHSHEGRHRKRLETWQLWAARSGLSLHDLPSVGEAKRTLEAVWPGAGWPWPQASQLCGKKRKR